MNNQESFIILGIDPGTRISGYGLIRLLSQGYESIDYGCICPPINDKLSERYLILYNSIDELIKLYHPSVLVVETQYVHKNVQSALKLGMARGMALIAAKKNGLAVYEYAPSEAKRAVTGNGQAQKYQVQQMVQHLLKLDELPHPEDASDALALAICHAHMAAHLQATKEI